MLSMFTAGFFCGTAITIIVCETVARREHRKWMEYADRCERVIKKFRKEKDGA